MLNMKALKIFLIGAVVVVIVFLVVVAMQPAAYSVVRSTTIAAPPGVVFGQVNDLHKFQAWSPWAEIDPNCKYTFEGPATGTGSAFSWTGNSSVGAGKMTITESKPSELVHARLDFFKPFAGVGEAEYTFKPQGDKTVVTWTMTGEKVFITKAIGLFISMDKMLGPQFEKGLEKLKAIAEANKVAEAAVR